MPIKKLKSAACSKESSIVKRLPTEIKSYYNNYIFLSHFTKGKTMHKRYLLAIFLSFSSLTFYGESPKQPIFADSIPLFEHRNFSTRIAEKYPTVESRNFDKITEDIIAHLDPALISAITKDTTNLLPISSTIAPEHSKATTEKKVTCDLNPALVDAIFMAILKSKRAHDLIHEVSGRPSSREIGHDSSRHEVHTGKKIDPSFIALTFSGKETLEETIAALKKEGLAHNFFINRSGAIHPVTLPGESIEEALTHRPFSLGVSRRVIDGNLEQVDMNAASISISLIGKNEEGSTPDQDTALTELIAYLTSKYKISIDNVIDYGSQAAFPHGRRQTQFNLPIAKLASKDLAIWPKEDDISEYLSFQENDMTIFSVASALRQIGYPCPLTDNTQDQGLVKAITAFQELYCREEEKGTITDHTVACIYSIIKQKKSIKKDA